MEVINLNLIPTGALPVVHASQYDEGRTFRANLMDGSTVYTLDGTETLECDVKKPDGNIVTVAVTNTTDSYVEIDTTLQMCACAGDSLAELHITKGAQELGTLNFILAVERSPLEGGIESESEIDNLATQVAGLVASEVEDQYDSANVIFDDEPTEGHGNGYTVTSEGIGNAIDNALDMTDTASGAIATFESEYALPLRDLEIEINAVQSGSGTPTPSNPRAISGFDSGVITRCGKNLFDYTQLTNVSDWSESGGVYSGSIGNLFFYARNGFPIQPKWVTDQQYVFKFKVNNASGNSRFRFIYTDNTYSDLVITSSNVGNYVSLVTDKNKTVSNLIFSYNTGGNLSISEMCLELGNTATTFEAYNGNTYTVDFGQTVYGGTLDVTSGVLTVTHGFIDLGTLSGWSYNPAQNFWYHAIPDMESNTNDALCEGYNYTNKAWGSMVNYEFGISGTSMRLHNDTVSTSAELETQLNGIHLKYLLTTPITLSITSQDVTTLIGNNNIFTDTNGDTSLEYYTKRGEQTVRIAEGVAVDVINNKNIDTLTTTNKTLVGAVNEVNTKYTNLGVTRIARGTANMDTTTKTITLSGFTSTPTIVATPYAYFKEVWITSASSSGFTINMNSTGAFVNWIAIGN